MTAATLIATAATVTAAQDADNLRILYVPSFTGHLPVLIAEDAGFFDKNGIQTELIGTNEAIKPLLSGDADVMLPAPAVVVLASAQGIGVKIISSVQSRVTQALVVRSEIAEAIPEAQRSYPEVLEALKGKKLGVTVRGGSVDLNLRYIITAGGMTPDEDIYVVPLGSGGAMVSGLRGNQVDGVLAFPPLSNMLIADGSAVSLIDLAKAEGPPALVQPFTVAAVLDTFLEEHPDVVEKFVAAIEETIDYIKAPENRDAVAEIVKARLEGIDPGLIDGIIEELVSTVEAGITREEIARVNEVQAALGLLDKEVAPEDILTQRLLDN